MQAPAPDVATSTDAKCSLQSGLLRSITSCDQAKVPASIGAAPLAEKELSWLQRRYGAVSRSIANPATAAKQEAAGEHQSSYEIKLQMTPSDPAWDRGAVLVTLAVAAHYPAAHTMQVVSASSCPAGKATISQQNLATDPAATHPLPSSEVMSGSKCVSLPSHHPYDAYRLNRNCLLATVITAQPEAKPLEFDVDLAINYESSTMSSNLFYCAPPFLHTVRTLAFARCRRSQAAHSSQQGGLSLVAAEVLAKLLTRYAARSGGAMPIMAAMRSLDSHGAHYAQQVHTWFILLEFNRSSAHRSRVPRKPVHKTFV